MGRGRGTWIAGAAALLLAASAALPVSAGPLDQRVVSIAFEYIPAELTVAHGTPVEYTNLDVAPHNVISLRLGKDGKPVFRTDTISAGSTVPIVGAEDLEPGVYDYICTLHPSMFGTIYVEEGSG